MCYGVQWGGWRGTIDNFGPVKPELGNGMGGYEGHSNCGYLQETVKAILLNFCFEGPT